MFLILSLLTTLCLSHEPIRSISHYENSPYILKKLNPNKCYKVILDMRVSCLYSGSAAFGITVANLYSSDPISRLYTSDIHFENGLNVAKTSYYDRIIIRNSTKLEIVKGYDCMNNPLNIEIYKLDLSEAECYKNLYNYDILIGLLFGSLFCISIICIIFRIQ